MTVPQAQMRDCPACEAADAHALDAYSPDPWEVAACDACDFVYLRNPPGHAALVEDFAWEKTYEAKKKSSRGSTPLSPLIRSIKQKTGLGVRNREGLYLDWFGPGHVLDIGCGDGRRIKPPMIPYGIELSRALHAEADVYMREHGGHCIHAAGAEGIWQFKADHFDGIIMNSYLEHEAEMMTVLRGAHRALKPGGKMFVRVPNYASLNRKIIGAKWCGFRYPDHVNYFTLASLTRAGEQAGFTTELVNRLTLPVDDNINALMTKPAHN